MHISARRLGAAATATLSLVLSLVVGAPASTPPAGARPPVSAGQVAAQVDAPVPQLTWRRCQDIKRTLCATADVPLDYDDPTGPTTRIALAKKPATDPGARLGTLFVNPGGPGGPARDFAPAAASLLGRTVARRYDVIGIDPRGVGESSPIRCRTELPDNPPKVSWSFPHTRAEARKTWRLGRLIKQACTDGPNPIVAHMSTADTARDMDLIRQAVGEEHLDYYGISYGTYLGAVYAALFPDRVGRFVVDGVLDPVNWAHGTGDRPRLPFTTRINSARGAYEALTSGLTECDRLGPDKCLFAGRALVKWRDLVRRAKAGSLEVEGDPVSYSLLVGATLGLLYDSDYSFLGALLRVVDDESRGAVPPAGASRVVAGVGVPELRAIAARVISAPYASPYAAHAARDVNLGDAFLGVSCSDTLNPTGVETWWHAGRAQDHRSPWFGSSWTWASAPCADWPAVTKEDSYQGDFTAVTANPILVVGNSFDPATPVQGARRFTTLFPGSRFLLLEGWGHGALGNGCVTSAFNAYYSSGALPVEGATCQPDRALFHKVSLE
jgi:pimeloyl-ACP methyl ester carboxylesterase